MAGINYYLYQSNATGDSKIVTRTMYFKDALGRAEYMIEHPDVTIHGLNIVDINTRKDVWRWTQNTGPAKFLVSKSELDKRDKQLMSEFRAGSKGIGKRIASKTK